MGQLGAVLQALQSIRDHLDLWGQAATFAGHQAGVIFSLLTAFLFQTVDPAQPGKPFTSLQVVQRYEPTVQLAADAGLTAALTWAFYKMMWVRASNFMSPLGLRQILPRTCLAAILINFATPLVQAAIDCNNALTAAIAVETRFTALDFLRDNLYGDLTTPGLRGLVGLILLASYLLLGFSYVVRFALLVVLTVLAPAAALLLILPDTQHWAHHWGTLFTSTLLCQPLQLFILAVAAELDVYGVAPISHVFALAAVYICFKVPGALRTSSMLGGRAATLARRRSLKLLKAAAK